MLAATAVLAGPVAGARGDTFIVQNTNDSGAGSLREAITGANAAMGGATDVVDATAVNGQIDLQTALPTLTGAFEIRGPGASDLTVRRTTGEFRIFTVDPGADIVLSGLTIANGLTPGNELGGGILNGGSLTVLQSAVSGNSGYTGGGIRNSPGGELTVSSSTVSGNTARFPSGGGEGGAGISNFQGTVDVVNSTVSGNTTAGRGGGIINSVGTAPNLSVLTIENSTVAANAGEGSNLFNSKNGGTAILSYRSTIISDPQGSTTNCGGAGGGSSGLTSQGYNLADDATCSLTATADQPSTDPDLGPLADNGGQTQTMALPEGSPAVDKGLSFGLTADQRGFARPIGFPALPDAPGGDGADIGSFELQRPPDTAVDGKASAAKTQKQKGRKIVVKVKVKAGEDLDATASGKVTVKKKSYKLKKAAKSIAQDKSATLKLKPKKSKDNKKIAKALKKAKGKAKIDVILADGAGNSKKSKLSVTLKR
jgi:hypothetical protein